MAPKRKIAPGTKDSVVPPANTTESLPVPLPSIPLPVQSYAHLESQIDDPSTSDSDVEDFAGLEESESERDDPPPRAPATTTRVIQEDGANVHYAISATTRPKIQGGLATTIQKFVEGITLTEFESTIREHVSAMFVSNMRKSNGFFLKQM